MIRLDGVEYPDLATAATARGLQLSTVQDRIRRGMSLEDALSPRVHGRQRPVTIRGVPYPSIQTACKALGINYGTYEDRRRRGLTPEEALARPVRTNRGTPVQAKDANYPSIRAAAQALHLSPGTLRRRLALGQLLEVSDRAPRRSKPAGRQITIRAVTYSSYTQACRALGLSYNTYVARRRKGWSEIEALTAGRSSNVRGKPITWNGVTYPSLAAARAVHGVSAVCYYQRLRMGWSIEEAMGFVPRPPRNRQKRRYEINGKSFSTLREAALAVNLPVTTVTSRLSKGFSLAQALGFAPLPAKSPRPARKQSPRFNDEAGVFYIGGKEYRWKTP